MNNKICFRPSGPSLLKAVIARRIRIEGFLRHLKRPVPEVCILTVQGNEALLLPPEVVQNLAGHVSSPVYLLQRQQSRFGGSEEEGSHVDVIAVPCDQEVDAGVPGDQALNSGPEVGDDSISIQPHDPVVLSTLDEGLQCQYLGPGWGAICVQVVEEAEVVGIPGGVHSLVDYPLRNVGFGYWPCAD